MDDAMKDLGRRAIAAGWRWMPGCALVDDAKQGALGGDTVWRIGCAQVPCDIEDGQIFNGRYIKGTRYDMAQLPIPDFSDPATLGCLDAQLAERFGCPVVVTPFGKMFRAWRMLPPDVDEFDYRLCAIRTATTLAGAKVAALEAAPKVAP